MEDTPPRLFWPLQTEALAGAVGAHHKLAPPCPRPSPLHGLAQLGPGGRRAEWHGGSSVFQGLPQPPTNRAKENIFLSKWKPSAQEQRHCQNRCDGVDTKDQLLSLDASFKRCSTSGTLKPSSCIPGRTSHLKQSCTRNVIPCGHKAYVRKYVVKLYACILFCRCIQRACKYMHN